MTKLNLTFEEAEILQKRHLAGESLTKIANSIGIKDYRVLTTQFRKHNLKVLKSWEVFKKAQNGDLFEKIDTDFKAYMIGLLLSDGNVGKNSYTIKIKLQRGDRQLLLDIATQIYGEPKLYEYDSSPNCSTLQFGSKKIHQDLSKYGVIPNKTYNHFDFPNIPEELVSSFVRGYFDGDGTAGVYFNNDGNPKRGFGIISCNLKFLEQLKQKLNSIIGLEQGCITKKPMKNSGPIIAKVQTYCLSYNTIEYLQKLYVLLYKNRTIYLKRKKEKLYLCTLTSSELEELNYF
jgi:hypothetical protein